MLLEWNQIYVDIVYVYIYADIYVDICALLLQVTKLGTETKRTKILLNNKRLPFYLDPNVRC